MPDRDQMRSTARDVPPVGRPRGAAWRTLQADGIVWEGQVYLVGDEVDLAARVIVTHRAIAFVRGGAVVLEIPRAWLRPAPQQMWDGTVLLSVLAPGSTPYTQPETISLRMREGQPAAGHLVAMLAGSGARLAADVPPGDDFARGMLPPLPASVPSRPAAKPEPEPARSLFDDPDIFGSSFGVAPRSATPSWDAPARAERSDAPVSRAQLDPIVRQPAPPVSSAPERDWNLQPFMPVTHLVPKSHRRNRLGLVLRLGGVVGLLTAAALFGTGHVPSTFNGARPAPPPLPSATASSGRQGALQASTENPALVSSAGSPAEQTAVALGVGGGEPAKTDGATIERAAEKAGAPALPPPPQAGNGLAPAPLGVGGMDVGVTSPNGEAPRLGPPPKPADTTAKTQPAPAKTEETAPEPAAPAPSQSQQAAPAPAAPEAAQPRASAPAAPEATEPEVAAAAAPQPTAPETAAPAVAEPTPPEVTQSEVAAPVSPEPAAPQPAAPVEAAPQPAAAPPEVPTAPEAPAPVAPEQPAAPAGFAVAVERTARGATLPQFGLPRSADGQWLGVIASVTNTGSETLQVPLANAQLFSQPGGVVSPLDSGTGVVAGLIGINPALGPTDVLSLSPGETKQVFLLYLVPPTTDQYSLTLDGATVDLGPVPASS